MALFLSTFINKLDKKGRVSIPSQFRNILVNQNFQGIIAYSSFINQAIEACSLERIESIHNSIDLLDIYSDEKDAFATTILGGSIQLNFDNEGRISLPEHLIEFAKLEEQVCFVGKGNIFEIWNLENFNDHSLKAREIARNKRNLLNLRSETK